tara:strand:+ start:3161 stop:4378 length:1218 start_codon:yes stop_codon:yes gene_type:complete
MSGIGIIDDYPWTEVYYDDDLSSGSNDGTSAGNAWQSVDAMIAGVRAGHRVNIKKASSHISISATKVFPAGSQAGPIWYRGYEDTIEDGENVIFSIADTKFIDTAAGPQFFSNMTFNGNSNSVKSVFVEGHVDSQTTFYKCTFTNNAAGPCVEAREGAFIACTFENTGSFSSANYSAFVGSGVCVGCRFKAAGIVCDLSNDEESEHILWFKNTILSDSSEARAGIDIDLTFNEGSYATVLENSFFGAGDGVNISAQDAAYEAACAFIGNVFADCDQGLNHTGTAVYREQNAILRNAFGSMSTGNYGSNWGDQSDIFESIALSASPYSSNSTLDLNDTAGTGATCRDGGKLGVIGAGGEFEISAGDLGGVRHGSSDGIKPISLEAYANLPPTEIGRPTITRTSELT